MTLAKPLKFRGSFGIDINVFLKAVTETVTQLSVQKAFYQREQLLCVPWAE